MVGGSWQYQRYWQYYWLHGISIIGNARDIDYRDFQVSRYDDTLPISSRDQSKDSGISLPLVGDTATALGLWHQLTVIISYKKYWFASPPQISSYVMAVETALILQVGRVDTSSWA